MCACLSPGQSAPTPWCASRNSCSRPGFTWKRTALNAVMASLPLGRAVRRRPRAVSARIADSDRRRNGPSAAGRLGASADLCYTLAIAGLHPS